MRIRKFASEICWPLHVKVKNSKQPAYLGISNLWRIRIFGSSGIFAFLVCNSRNQYISLPDATLAGSSVMRMLCSVTSEHFISAIIPLQRNGNFKNVGARFDDFQNTMNLFPLFFFGDSHAFHQIHESGLSQNTSLVEIIFNHVKERWVVSSRDTCE